MRRPLARVQQELEQVGLRSDMPGQAGEKSIELCHQCNRLRARIDQDWGLVDGHVESSAVSAFGVTEHACAGRTAGKLELRGTPRSRVLLPPRPRDDPVRILLAEFPVSIPARQRWGGGRKSTRTRPTRTERRMYAPRPLLELPVVVKLRGAEILPPAGRSQREEAVTRVSSNGRCSSLTPSGGVSDSASAAPAARRCSRRVRFGRPSTRCRLTVLERRRAWRRTPVACDPRRREADWCRRSRLRSNAGYQPCRYRTCRIARST